MRILLVIFILLFFIGGACWFIFSTVSDSSKEEDNNTSLNAPINDVTNIDNQELKKNELNTSKKENSIDSIKVEPKESAPVIKNEGTSKPLEKPIEKQEIIMEKAVSQEEKSNPNSILETDSFISDKTDTRKEEIKKEMSFVDEKNLPLFGGKRIPIQEGKFEISTGVFIEFKKADLNGWQIKIESVDFFIDYQKNEFITQYNSTFNENSIAENQNLVISAYAIIQISLKFKDGISTLPDGTKCILSTDWFFEEEGIVNNGVAIIKVKQAMVQHVHYFYAGKFYSQFDKQLKLVRGETITFELELVVSTEQVFKVTDSSQKALEGYYVVFASGSNLAFNLSQYRKSFAANGKLYISRMTGVTGTDGIGKIPLIVNGNYTCHIFGKDHNEHSINVVVDDTRNTLELSLKDDEKKRLVLKVMENDKPFLNEVQATYYDMNEYSAVNNKAEIKITNGQIEINSLKPTKYQFQLNSNDFEREIVELDFNAVNNTEHTFHLKSSGNYIFGYVKNKQGEPVEKVQLSFGFNYKYFKAKTDNMGYYKVGGLEKDQGYTLYISSDYPKPTNLPKLIYPSTNEFNITFEDKIYFTGTVLGLDGKPIDSYKVSMQVFKDKNLKDFSLSTGGEAHNGKFSIQVYSYGYYEIIIKLTDAAFIHKVFPILSAEENLPVILQAEPGFSISGTVTDFENTILENVSITRNEYHGPNVTRVYDEILKTDKNGYFKLDHCLVGEKYWVVKIGYAPIILTIKEEDKNVPLKLSFIKSYKLKGSLIGTDKVPHRLIQVVGNLKGAKRFEIVSETDAEGKFLINTITPGEWYFYFNIKTAKGKKKPGQWVTITDKDEEINLEYDIPK